MSSSAQKQTEEVSNPASLTDAEQQLNYLEDVEKETAQEAPEEIKSNPGENAPASEAPEIIDDAEPRNETITELPTSIKDDNDLQIEISTHNEAETPQNFIRTRFMNENSLSEMDDKQRYGKPSKGVPNSSVYSVREDFLLMEKIIEFGEARRKFHNMRKVDFFSQIEEKIGRTYSSLSKRVDRLQNVSMMIKFVVYFFCKSYWKVTHLRKIIMPSQAKDIIIVCRDDGELPPQESAYVNFVKKVFQRPTLPEINQLYAFFKERWQHTEGDSFPTRYFTKNVEEFFVQLCTKPGFEGTDYGREPVSNSAEKKPESNALKAKESSGKSKRKEAASPLSSDSAEKERASEGSDELGDTKLKKRSRGPGREKPENKPTRDAVGGIVTLKHLLNPTESRVFEIVINQLCSKFALTRAEVLAGINLAEEKD